MVNCLPSKQKIRVRRLLIKNPSSSSSENFEHSYQLTNEPCNQHQCLKEFEYDPKKCYHNTGIDFAEKKTYDNYNSIYSKCDNFDETIKNWFPDQIIENTNYCRNPTGDVMPYCYAKVVIPRIPSSIKKLDRKQLYEYRDLFQRANYVESNSQSPEGVEKEVKNYCLNLKPCPGPFGELPTIPLKFSYLNILTNDITKLGLSKDVNDGQTGNLYSNLGWDPMPDRLESVREMEYCQFSETFFKCQEKKINLPSKFTIEQTKKIGYQIFSTKDEFQRTINQIKLHVCPSNLNNNNLAICHPSMAGHLSPWLDDGCTKSCGGGFRKFKRICRFEPCGKNQAEKTEKIDKNQLCNTAACRECFTKNGTDYKGYKNEGLIGSKKCVENTISGQKFEKFCRAYDDENKNKKNHYQKMKYKKRNMNT